METKECPYCGETIMASSKKCRYCGEWFTEAAPVAVYAEDARYENAEIVPTPTVNSNAALPKEMLQSAVASALTSQQNPPTAQPNSQQAVGVNNVMPQITVNVVQQVQQENTQVQETEVVVAQSGSSTSSWWIWIQLLSIGGLAWGLSGHWWVGFITLIVLTIGLMIPVLGHAMCVILALGVGLLAGAVSAAFGAPTWAAWIIGIVAGVGAAYNNLESRKTFIEED